MSEKKLKRLLVTGVIAINLFMSGIALFFLYEDRQRQIEKVSITALNLATVLELNFSAVINTIELMKENWTNIWRQSKSRYPSLIHSG